MPMGRHATSLLERQLKPRASPRLDVGHGRGLSKNGTFMFTFERGAVVSR